MNVWDFVPLGNAITPLQRGGVFSICSETFATTLKRFIDIIHSTENKPIKESTTSVNSNYKSSHVVYNFMVIYIMLIRRVGMKSGKFVYGRYNLNLLFILYENNLSTYVFSLWKSASL